MLNVTRTHIPAYRATRLQLHCDWTATHCYTVHISQMHVSGRLVGRLPQPRPQGTYGGPPATKTSPPKRGHSARKGMFLGWVYRFSGFGAAGPSRPAASPASPASPADTLKPKVGFLGRVSGFSGSRIWVFGVNIHGSFIT